MQWWMHEPTNKLWDARQIQCAGELMQLATDQLACLSFLNELNRVSHRLCA